MNNATIPEALEQLRRGGILIVLDDDDRENEGDFILSAELATPQSINFLAAEGRGLICVALPPDRAKALDLSIPQRANALHGTGFTESVDLAALPGTGISASDRCETIQALASPLSKPEDFARPGHVFPLIAKPAGVLERRGHTEATVDLCRLAGLQPVGVLCEIMNPDGTMARRPQLEEVARRHGFPIITVEQLAQYRRLHEAQARETSKAILPTKWGDFTLHYFATTDGEVLALTPGPFADALPQSKPLVRLHSECLTGEAFGSLRCDCGPQLDKALEQIAQEKHGAVIYLRQEGRGIGLEAKVKAYALQDQGLDTWDANTAQGLPADARTYDAPAAILRAWGWHSLRLMTNNPQKVEALRRHGIEVEVVPLSVGANSSNQTYLKTKKERFGHWLEPGAAVKEKP